MGEPVLIFGTLNCKDGEIGNETAENDANHSSLWAHKICRRIKEFFNDNLKHPLDDIGVTQGKFQFWIKNMVFEIEKIFLEHKQ